MAEVFYEDSRTTLYKGDCLEVLAGLPQESVDLIFADPPYKLSNGGITCHAGRMVPVDKGEWDRSHGIDADHEFTLAWLKLCRKILKPNGTIWVSGTMHIIYSVGFAMQALGYRLLNDIAWFKPNASPNLSCRYFTHSHETLIWAARDSKSKHTFNYDLMRQLANGKQMRSVWELPETTEALDSFPPDLQLWSIATPSLEEKRYGKHPTQKPLGLLERVILASSNPGDLVLDPFHGSGTTGIAAVKLGRRYIGIEISTEYLELSLKRLHDLALTLDGALAITGRS